MRFLSFALLFAIVLTPLFADKGDKKVTDDILNDQVRVRMANDADIGGMKIDVEVHEGVVTLSGKVRTEHQKAKAEKVVKKVKGVTAVTNKLIVRPD